MDKEGDIIGIEELNAMPENQAIVLFESKLYLNEKGFRKDYNAAIPKVRAFYDSHAHLKEADYYKAASQAAYEDPEFMAVTQ